MTKAIQSLDELEKSINEYKYFYKHFFTIKDQHDAALSAIQNLRAKINRLSPKSPLLTNSAHVTFEVEAESVLKKYFGVLVFNYYNSKFNTDESKPASYNRDENFFVNLLTALAAPIAIATEQNEKEFKHKTNFIYFIYNCLFNYGLHPNILKRDPEKFKRYLIWLKHDFKTFGKSDDAFRLVDSYEILKSEYLNPYERKVPIQIHGKLIPFKNIHHLRIASTFLKDDEIELFALQKKFNWNQYGENYYGLFNNCFEETNSLLRNPYLLDETTLFKNNKSLYVDPIRIKELHNLKNSKFDVIKLIKLCEELNNAATNKNYLSVPIIVRTIIDHIPPIFGFSTFSEVANNYSGGTRSFKESMLNFNNSLRKIADNNTHSQAREKEVLPSLVQVDFSPQLDMLLGEIIRIQK